MNQNQGSLIQDFESQERLTSLVNSVPVAMENQLELMQLFRTQDLQSSSSPTRSPLRIVFRRRSTSNIPFQSAMSNNPPSTAIDPMDIDTGNDLNSTLESYSNSNPQSMPGPPIISRARSEPTPAVHGVSEENLRKWVAHETATSRSEILSRLYNYMKISEMDRYGIPVFERILETYLPVLDESDICTLVTSYWCNGIHFQSMIKYRGVLLKDNRKLELSITDALLDSAITGGSTVEKIREMLRQRRSDLNNVRQSQKKEKDFFIRNCQYRLWNHEVLVKSFLQNGWLNQQLSQIALDRFCSHIYDRAMNGCVNWNGQRYCWTTDGDTDLSSPTSSQEIDILRRSSILGVDTDEERRSMTRSPVSSKIIKRWRSLVEILTSRGAKCNPSRFQLPMLQVSVVAGTNTWKFISSKPERKNGILYDACALRLPSELWHIIVCHL